MDMGREGYYCDTYDGQGEKEVEVGIVSSTSFPLSFLSNSTQFRKGKVTHDGD